MIRNYKFHNPEGGCFVSFAKTFYEHTARSAESDEETGYYYYGARYYNPSISTWLSVDPLAEKYPSISPYVYVANNPIIYIDPDARQVASGSQKEYDKQKQNVISQRDELKGKIDAFNEATGVNLDVDDYLGAETPRELSNTIIEKGANTPQNPAVNEKDSSSF